MSCIRLSSCWCAVASNAVLARCRWPNLKGRQGSIEAATCEVGPMSDWWKAPKFRSSPCQIPWPLQIQSCGSPEVAYAAADPSSRSLLLVLSSNASQRKYSSGMIDCCFRRRAVGRTGPQISRVPRQAARVQSTRSTNRGLSGNVIKLCPTKKLCISKRRPYVGTVEMKSSSKIGIVIIEID